MKTLPKEYPAHWPQLTRTICGRALTLRARAKGWREVIERSAYSPEFQRECRLHIRRDREEVEGLFQLLRESLGLSPYPHGLKCARRMGLKEAA
jgi:hypothetical protein